MLKIIVLLGAIQGVIISVLLLNSKKGNAQGDRCLAAMLFLLSIACLDIYLMESGFKHISPTWYAVSLVLPLIITFPIGPLLYFYLLSSLNPEFKLTKKHLLHFYPVLLDLLPYFLGIAYLAATAINLLDLQTGEQWIGFMDNYQIYIDILRWISITIYVVHSFKLLNAYSRNSLTNTHFRWLRQLVYIIAGFQFIWVVQLFPYILPSFRDQLLNLVGWYPIYVPVVILVYWIGIHGYFINHAYLVPEKRGNPRLAVSYDTIVQTKTLLRKAMEEDRLFLDPTVNLNKIVNHTGISQKTVSWVLNQHIGKSFTEFVNEYRVNEMKKRLSEPGHEHLTLTGMALECGFNSQATFQRAFKQMTNLSPKEFQRADVNTGKMLVNSTQI